MNIQKQPPHRHILTVSNIYPINNQKENVNVNSSTVTFSPKYLLKLVQTPLKIPGATEEFLDDEAYTSKQFIGSKTFSLQAWPMR